MTTALFPRIPTLYRRLLQAGLLGGVAVIASLVVGQSVPPLVDLATEPLYMNGAKAKGNLSIALSVEFPTVGQTYRDTTFDPTREYVGYFDPRVCYRHVPGNGTINGGYFDWTAAVPAADGACGGGGFNGNFMNWATSSAIDILRYGLTGGNRVLDDANTTIVERAWLPDNFYNNSSYFGVKVVSRVDARKYVETSLGNKFTGGQVFIYNCKNRLYFSNVRDDGSGTCDRPHDILVANNNNLVTGGNDKFYQVRNLVCDSNSATNREMTYDTQTKQWKGLCLRYGTKYKPVGQFQVNSESLRVSVFGYLNDDVNTRYGGVMRSPLKYLGPRAFDANFNLIPGDNPVAEWNKTTGVLIQNPQTNDTTGSYGNQGYASSGAIQYINKFGTLHTAGDYKSFDPVSELYYEVLRYLQGKQPTPEAYTGVRATSGTAAENRITENYPVYRTWANPFTGFQDAAGEAPSCLRNSILTIADVFTHKDRTIPGHTVADGAADQIRAAEVAPPLNAATWTRVVGGFESGVAVNYTDSQGRAQTTSNLASNTLYPGLTLLDTLPTGAGGNAGSYYMAGLAYWANTQTFNAAYPKARVRTFSIDVNENRASDNTDFRRTRQLYLAAKYGGFDDRAADQTGNPYQPGSNLLWQGADGEAQNYFLVSDARKFLDSLAEVFARVVEETGSIAGGAISTTRLTSSEAAAVYQARFNPVANFWSGRLLKFPIALSGDGQSIVLSTTETWEAGERLTLRTRSDNGANRNIVIGAPKGLQGTVAPANFVWNNDLPAAHKLALDSMPDGSGTDTLGINRLAWLRGDQREEQSAAVPLGQFRTRDSVLGDIVNSGIVFVGRPSQSTPGADFRTFFEANRSRPSILYVNANDGMLHGFKDSDGSEAFAYIPGFLANKLSKLPDRDYMHIGMADATPAIADAKVGNTWKTVLVSGVGGGAQGVYALDVTDPLAFNATKVMWEFTDQDHAALGNVLGAPQILKFRQGGTAAAPTYKYYAVVASGVNNNAPDGFAHASGNASLFLLDLAFVPASGSSWTEGTNFWRIELPQSLDTMAKGLVSFSAVKNTITGAVDQVYAGDMQGNVWKLDFSGTPLSSLTANAATNYSTFNKVRSAANLPAPLFVATATVAGSPVRQPITGEPSVLNAFTGQKLISFGTGKFLEVNDTTVPLSPTASFYTIMDTGIAPIAGRTELVAGSMSNTGTVTVPSFVWGTAASQREGWFLDFDASFAERQISDITALGGRILFGSIFPTRGSCGEGGGRLYILDPLAGSGSSEESQVGVLAAPLVINLGSTGLTGSDTTGQRTATERLGVITQGSRGLRTSTLTSVYQFQVGRVTWRQLNNFQSNRNAP